MDFQVEYFGAAIVDLLKHTPMTLFLSIIAMFFSVGLGILINLLLRCDNFLINWGVKLYVSFFRGTPLLVQLFIIYFGLPQIFPSFTAINSLTAAIIGLTLNNAAYVSEIIRGGVKGVNRTQLEAAYSLNLSDIQIFKLLIYPQTLRLILPAIGNNFMGLIKETSLTFTLGLSELMARSQSEAALTFRYMEQYLAVALVYWVMIILTEIIQHFTEKKLNLAYS